MNTLEAVFNTLERHREARAWNPKNVAADVLAQLGIDPTADAPHATPAAEPADLPTVEAVALAEETARAAVAEWETLRRRRHAYDAGRGDGLRFIDQFDPRAGREGSVSSAAEDKARAIEPAAIEPAIGITWPAFDAASAARGQPGAAGDQGQNTNAAANQAAAAAALASQQGTAANHEAESQQGTAADEAAKGDQP